MPEGASAHVVLPDHPERQEEDVDGGTYGWSWKPTRDYLHPFSIESRMMDLLENPDAAAIVRQCVPPLFGACQGRDNELRVMKPMQVADVMPLDRQAIRNMDDLLRQVKQ